MFVARQFDWLPPEKSAHGCLNIYLCVKLVCMYVSTSKLASDRNFNARLSHIFLFSIFFPGGETIIIGGCCAKQRFQKGISTHTYWRICTSTCRYVNAWAWKVIVSLHNSHCRYLHRYLRDFQSQCHCHFVFLLNYDCLLLCCCCAVWLLLPDIRLKWSKCLTSQALWRGSLLLSVGLCACASQRSFSFSS